MLVAVLLLAAVVSTIAAAIVAGDGGDGAADRRLEERVATLTVERDDALGDVAELDAELAALRTELAAAQAGGDELSARVAELESELAAAAQERVAALATVTELTAQRDEALAEVADLTGDVVDLTDEVADVRASLAAAIAERDALVAATPSEFDVSLVGVDVDGSYRAKVTDVYGTSPKFTGLTITETTQGWLRASIPGFAEGGLSMVDGVLHMVTGSTTVLPKCDGVARSAHVAMTIYPSGYEVGTDGATVSGLNAVVTVDAPATGSCPAVLTYATAALTPTT